jgi:uncharacterized Tic20 family protein
MENNPFPPTSPTPGLSSEQRSLGMWMHLAPLLAIPLNMFIPIPFLGLVATLVLYYSQRDKGEFVSSNGKESVNFQITLALVGILIFIIMMIFFGGSIFSMIMGGASGSETAAGAGVMGLIGTSLIVGLVVMVVGIGAIVLMIIGTIRANSGQVYRYPISIRLVK